MVVRTSTSELIWTLLLYRFDNQLTTSNTLLTLEKEIRFPAGPIWK